MTLGLYTVANDTLQQTWSAGFLRGFRLSGSSSILPTWTEERLPSSPRELWWALPPRYCLLLKKILRDLCLICLVCSAVLGFPILRSCLSLSPPSVLAL